MKYYVIMAGTLGVLFSIAVVWFIRRNHMHVQYSLWWIMVAAIAMVLGFFPRLLDQLAVALGVDYPPTLLFLWAIIALFFKVLLGDVERTRSQRRLLRLTQRVVMLENEIKGLEGRLRDRPPKDAA